MAVTRRELLYADTGLLAATALPLWVRPARAAAQRRGSPLLAVIFLRGAADGLHLVVPLGDRDYARQRGGLELDATLPFTQSFGLHPALEPLAPLIDRGELAVVHAAGSPDPTRTHFDAQDFMETGTPGSHTVGSGWMARALGPVSDDALFSRLAVTSGAPLSLRGSGALALDNPQQVGLGRLHPRSHEALARLYAEGASDDPVVVAGRLALVAAQRIRELRLRGPGSRRGNRMGLSARAETVAALERGGVDVEAVFLDTQGWDTHTNQGTTQGAVANQAGDLARAVARLHDTVGRRRELTCLVMTEFGRTVRPNGSGGTDHGHGSVMLVTGRRVKGGVHGAWRGVDKSVLYEGRDLPVLNDFRDVARETLAAHLGKSPPADTFPGHAPSRIGLFSA